MALGWAWALGTAAGFALVGLLVHAEPSAAQTPLVNLPLSADDISLADGAG
ncbi:hypothetical protein [Streptomyces sp. NPDC052042]|uniref:hypothetical protein n=1 Tax=Streptomyces sp. NPDC052042 TaxID=3365683 RepID=UPI0037D12CF4